MEDDEVLRIAVLGSGPVGLEAALYGRYLGYHVAVFDDRDTCAALANDETLLDSSFRDYCTSLGLAALDAQDSKYERADADQILSIGQWMSRYCIPLSQTDLIADSSRIGWVVESIEFDSEAEIYRLVAHAAEDGSPVPETFDYVLDARRIPLLSTEAREKEDFAAAKTDDFFKIESGPESLDFVKAVDEIRQAYAAIGERDDLNLYETLTQFRI